jgi:hypothetical protein
LTEQDGGDGRAGERGKALAGSEGFPANAADAVFSLLDNN